MKILISFILLVGITFQLSGQVHDRLHWVIAADSVEQIQIDLIDPYEISKWDGNQIMVTSEITIYNASKGLLHFFVEDNKRYDVTDTLQAGILLLDSYQSHRAIIESKGQPCHEEVIVKIFMPNKFMESSPTLWLLKED